MDNKYARWSKKSYFSKMKDGVYMELVFQSMTEEPPKEEDFDELISLLDEQAQQSKMHDTYDLPMPIHYAKAGAYVMSQLLVNASIEDGLDGGEEVCRVQRKYFEIFMHNYDICVDRIFERNAKKVEPELLDGVATDIYDELAQTLLAEQFIHDIDDLDYTHDGLIKTLKEKVKRLCLYTAYRF